MARPGARNEAGTSPVTGDLAPRPGVALAAGTLATALVAAGAPASTLLLRGSYMDLDFSTPAAIFGLFALAALWNPLVRRLSPRLALRPGELIVVYVMMAVATSLTTMGLVCQVLPIPAAAQYYKSGGRPWGDLLSPALRPWLYLKDDFAATRFFEGLRSGEPIPWRPWLPLLAVWLPFLIAMYWASLCLMAILRRQWADRERLAYPLTQLPLEMARPGARPLLRSWVMWAGFAMPFAVGSMIGLHQYYPSFPEIALAQPVPAWRGTLSLQLRCSFPMIGFFYLVNTETVFSLWVFNLLGWTARGAMNLLGVEWTENVGPFGANHPAFKYLGMGAIGALVLIGFWSALPHLASSLRAAFLRRRGEDAEPLSYRAAWLGLGGGLAVMFGWLWLTGIPVVTLICFLAAAFALFVGLTRLVVEAGLAQAVPSTIAPGYTVAALGVNVAGRESLAPLAMTYVWCSDLRTFPMAAAANAFKMGEASRRIIRLLPGAMVAAILLTLAVATPLTLWLAYTRGGVNLNSWFFINGPVLPFKWARDKLLNPADASIVGWSLTAAGAAFTGFLAFMRQRYVWWPFHPAGFAVGHTWLMDQLWLSAFVAWAVKALIVRYGGLRLFGAARPFFLGLILGQFTCNGFWLILDALSGARGNQIFWI